MTVKLFWLDDLQWASIKPYIPSRKQRGPRRQDDRRIVSGIIHVLQSGCRWRDCPKEYGPSTTIYNRFHRWSPLSGVITTSRKVDVALKTLWPGSLDETQKRSPFGGT